MNLFKLYQKEGWDIVEPSESASGDYEVKVYGETFPATKHPFIIHSKLYRTLSNPETKYLHFKAMHDYLWPDDIATWHDWTERRFRAHCEDWKFITWAGPASSSKSWDEAKINVLFWLADPKNRAVIVASTTLESAEGRVWGYITSHLKRAALQFPYSYYGSKPQKILNKHEKTKGSEAAKIKDTIHGIFAVAAKRGDDATTIREWIGRHPKKALKVTLDECTDMPPAILGAVGNLEKSPWFQLCGIGNSDSWDDLHGLLSTPEDGIDSINPETDFKWLTTQDKGVCLFFNGWDSPAIREQDPVKKKRLGVFLPTLEQMKHAEKTNGKNSELFWRFDVGFWKSKASSATLFSDIGLKEHDVKSLSLWSGLRDLRVVAGLDPAFSTGGDDCVLRLAYLGQNIDGNYVLDYRGNKLLFYIPIQVIADKSPELQIADQVIKILEDFHCPIDALCVDSNGQGRALGELIALRAKSTLRPIKMYSVRDGNKKKNSFDVEIKTSLDLWDTMKNYIQTSQIKGLDDTTIYQLTNRKVELNEKTNKLSLELKTKYKTRMGAVSRVLAKSPDEADAATLALQAAILRYGFQVESKREWKPQSTVDLKMALHQREELSRKLHEANSGRSIPKNDFRKGLSSRPYVTLPPAAKLLKPS